MGIDFKQMVELQKAMMDQISVYMSALGLELKLDRIDIEPEDCPDLCVDMVWRFTCKDKEICSKLKEKIMEAFGGEQVGYSGGGD